jgi:hypothetical protein
MSAGAVYNEARRIQRMEWHSNIVLPPAYATLAKRYAGDPHGRMANSMICGGPL